MDQEHMFSRTYLFVLFNLTKLFFLFVYYEKDQKLYFNCYVFRDMEKWPEFGGTCPHREGLEKCYNNINFKLLYKMEPYDT